MLCTNPKAISLFNNTFDVEKVIYDINKSIGLLEKDNVKISFDADNSKIIFSMENYEIGFITLQ